MYAHNYHIGNLNSSKLVLSQTFIWRIVLTPHQQCICLVYVCYYKEYIKMGDWKIVFASTLKPGILLELHSELHYVKKLKLNLTFNNITLRQPQMTWLCWGIILNTHYRSPWQCYYCVTIRCSHSRAVTDNITRIAQAFICNNIELLILYKCTHFMIQFQFFHTLSLQHEINQGRSA